MRKLFLDLGHSKRFPGASGFRDEVSWVREIALILFPLLDCTKWELAKVPDTFLNDLLPGGGNRNLINRINWINKKGLKTDHLLSIHANAASTPKARGVETLFYGGSQESEKAAIVLSQSYAKATNIPLFGDGADPDTASRFGRLGIIRDTHPSAFLIECGFVTNKLDMSVDPKLAAQGIANYFNTI